jgi:ParB-like chromosome segregation protein Spo0J
MKIKTSPIDRLIPYAMNARTHSDAQVSQIAASIKEFGFNNPVLVDPDGGIIAGHGRVMAAKKLGLESVPTIELGHLSDAQKRAYILADNRLALNAGWDEEMLSAELARLDGEIDLDLLGFDDDELAGLMGGDVDELADMPGLPDGDREPFQQMTFTLHDEQAEQVKAAMDAAKALGPFIDSPNENSNGNALARICETYLSHA